MARQQRFDWFISHGRARKRKTARRRAQRRQIRFEPLEVRVLLSANAGLEADEASVQHAYAAADHAEGASGVDYFPAEYWQGEHEPLAASSSEGGAEADTVGEDVLTIILDFIEPGQENGVDIFNNVVTTFDVEAYGFSPDEYDMVTEAILEEVRSDYYDIATSDVFPESAIPPNMELNVEFFIGDQGTPPINGATEYYYMQIGTFISGDCAGALGCAGLNAIRDAQGRSGGGFGSVVGSVFSDVIQGIGGLDPSNALSSGNLEFTTAALSGTTSHEIGHAVSLNHLAKAGSVTPNGVTPIMGTGAIDTPNQDRIGPREFAASGVNPQLGGQMQFHIAQLVGAIGLTEAGSGTRGPAIQVDTLSDVNDGDLTEGNVSLREAIEEATIDGRRRAIEFSETLAGGTITLDPELGSLVIPGPIVIEGLEGSDRVTVEAPAPNPALAEGGDGQVFLIQYGEQAATSPLSVEIRDLILTGANSTSDGGAIYTEHDLVTSHVAIRNSSTTGRGGGIYASGALLDITAGEFSGNSAVNDGGALYSDATVLVDESLFHNNSSSDDGGAIALVGAGNQVIITSSTLSGNTATDDGGAIHNIDDNPEIFRVLHSTVFQNTSTGGSGGGIYMQDGVLALEHSIVAGNSDAQGAPDIDNINPFATPAVIARYSLIQDPTGSNIDEDRSNLIGADPLLNALADNGGPTMTHTPQTGSPVLNAGNASIPVAPDNDQRGPGFNRILETVIDIGAVESGGFEQTFTVNSTLDKEDIDDLGTDASPEDLTLREAIILSNLQLGKNLINFEASLSGETINLDNSLGELVVTDTLTIDATSLAVSLTVNAATADPTPTENNGDGIRILRTDDGSAETYIDVVVMGLELVGADVSGDGGAIHSIENLTLQYVTVEDNSAAGRGGGVYHRAGATGGMLLIDSSTIAGNEAIDDGGGVWSNTNLPAEPDPNPDPNAIVGKILNSTISGNVAGDEGGGIMNFDGQLELRHVTITENEADNGSGVVSFGDTFTRTLVYSSIISGNVINENNPNDEFDDTGFDVQRSRNVAFSSFESLGFNLIGSGDALLSFDNDDLTNVTDPLLGPLADNGGKTKTHLPSSDSPVVDAGEVPYQELLPTLSTRAYYKLDDPAGSELVETISQSGNTPISVPHTTALEQPGATAQTGTSTRFLDGATEPSGFAAGEFGGIFNNDYTIALWFQTETQTSSSPDTDTQTLLSLVGDDPIVLEGGIQLNSDGTIQTFGTAIGELASTTSYMVDQWHHLVLVRESNELKLYIDGVLDADAVAPADAFSLFVEVNVGYSVETDTARGQYNGFMDEFSLHGQALSAVEVASLFSSSEATEVDFEQRGDPFARSVDGDNDGNAVVDIGAVEFLMRAPNADFNSNGRVEGSDFLAWQIGKGTINAQLSDGDSDYDGDVDADDLQNWVDLYGTTGPALDFTTLEAASSATSFNRQPHRPTATTGYAEPVGLFAAVHDYFLSDSPVQSDDADSRTDTVGNELLAAVGDHSAWPLPANARLATSPSEVSDRDEDASDSDTNANDPLDEAFASIGQEQPVLSRGV